MKSKTSKKSRPICLRLPIDELEFFLQVCQERDISMTELVHEALTEKYFPGEDPDMYYYGHA